MDKTPGRDMHLHKMSGTGSNGTTDDVDGGKGGGKDGGKSAMLLFCERRQHCLSSPHKKRRKLERKHTGEKGKAGCRIQCMRGVGEDKDSGHGGGKVKLLTSHNDGSMAGELSTKRLSPEVIANLRDEGPRVLAHQFGVPSISNPDLSQTSGPTGRVGKERQRAEYLSDDISSHLACPVNEVCVCAQEEPLASIWLREPEGEDAYDVDRGLGTVLTYTAWRATESETSCARLATLHATLHASLEARRLRMAPDRLAAAYDLDRGMRRTLRHTHTIGCTTLLPSHLELALLTAPVAIYVPVARSAQRHCAFIPGAAYPPSNILVAIQGARKHAHYPGVSGAFLTASRPKVHPLKRGARIKDESSARDQLLTGVPCIPPPFLPQLPQTPLRANRAHSATTTTSAHVPHRSLPPQTAYAQRPDRTCHTVDSWNHRTRSPFSATTLVLCTMPAPTPHRTSTGRRSTHAHTHLVPLAPADAKIPATLRERDSAAPLHDSKSPRRASHGVAALSGTVYRVWTSSARAARRSVHPLAAEIVLRKCEGKGRRRREAAASRSRHWPRITAPLRRRAAPFLPSLGLFAQAHTQHFGPAVSGAGTGLRALHASCSLLDSGFNGWYMHRLLCYGPRRVQCVSKRHTG
ncbi:hypothetical protein K488DRAFT_74804 [Vararia minispora EC-137]|uniref:Uncharacterized protein n=1 Tax=Vararia minispora EC-137 TaxID=1314806 RepID=A0ACB8Q697_9AGAM|nr:hypothetical protein K488DRAFT_74804 [Vararia minispora EC-137]